MPIRFGDVRLVDPTVRRIDRTGIGTSSTRGRSPEHPNGPGTGWEGITGLRIEHNEATDVGGGGIVVQTARPAGLRRGRPRLPREPDPGTAERGAGRTHGLTAGGAGRRGRAARTGRTPAGRRGRMWSRCRV
ncbi:hypothetical protein [Streptomyces wuyuanensis]|uniref:hypothetical protein n=1 Tax=Streptomyces wuyuanensis TaxID=1196353 RepID=UPI0034242A5D